MSASKTILLPIEYDLFETVYLKTDAHRDPRIVVGITISGEPTVVTYRLASGHNTSVHFGQEITREAIFVK